MSKPNSIIQQAANGQSAPVELSEQQVDTVAGGTKTIDQASPNLFAHCSSGKHIQHGVITC